MFLQILEEAHTLAFIPFLVIVESFLQRTEAIFQLALLVNELLNLGHQFVDMLLRMLVIVLKLLEHIPFGEVPLIHHCLLDLGFNILFEVLPELCKLVLDLLVVLH